MPNGYSGFGITQGIRGAIDSFNAMFRLQMDRRESAQKMRFLEEEGERRRRRFAMEETLFPLEFEKAGAELGAFKEKGALARQRREQEETLFPLEERRTKAQIGAFERKEELTQQQMEQEEALFPGVERIQEQTLANMKRKAKIEEDAAKRLADLHAGKITKQELEIAEKEADVSLAQMRAEEERRILNDQRFDRFGTAIAMIDKDQYVAGNQYAEAVVSEIERVSGMTVRRAPNGVPMADFDANGNFILHFNEIPNPVPVTEDSIDELYDIEIKKRIGEPRMSGKNSMIWNRDKNQWEWSGPGIVNRSIFQKEQFDKMLQDDKFIKDELEPLGLKGPSYITKVRNKIDEAYDHPYLARYLQFTPPRSVWQITQGIDQAQLGTHGLSSDDEEVYWENWGAEFQTGVLAFWGKPDPDRLLQQEIERRTAIRDQAIQAGDMQAIRGSSQVIPAMREIYGGALEKGFRGASGLIKSPFIIGSDILDITQLMLDLDTGGVTWDDVKDRLKRSLPAEVYEEMRKVYEGLKKTKKTKPEQARPPFIRN